jgi:hypothetical protein
MKIAYVTFERQGNQTGKGKKIEFQIEEWMRLGHQVVHIVLNVAPFGETSAATRYVFKRNVIKPMLSAVLSRGRLRAELEAYQPDVVYVRQMPWWPGLVHCLKGFNVIQEINSDMENEYRLFRGISSLKFYLYKFSKDFQNSVTKGDVFVSRELANKYSVEGVPYCVIGNGYQFNETFQPDKKTNQRPQLIFACSGIKPWHGLDKVVQLARLIPEMDFHIVTPDHKQGTHGNLCYHGGMYGEDLLSLYRQMDFGIGSLAFHRLSMSEGSVLKTREYAANGLPIIAGYEDTDLCSESYFVNIGNYEDNVSNSGEKIRAFVKQWTGKPFPYNDARTLLSVERKERDRLVFFERVLGSGRS